MAENTLLLDFATFFWPDFFIYWIIGYPSLLNLKVFTLTNFFRLPVILSGLTLSASFCHFLGIATQWTDPAPLMRLPWRTPRRIETKVVGIFFLNLKVVTPLLNVKQQRISLEG